MFRKSRVVLLVVLFFILEQILWGGVKISREPGESRPHCRFQEGSPAEAGVKPGTDSGVALRGGGMLSQPGPKTEAEPWRYLRPAAAAHTAQRSSRSPAAPSSGQPRTS